MVGVEDADNDEGEGSRLELRQTYFKMAGRVFLLQMVLSTLDLGYVCLCSSRSGICPIGSAGRRSSPLTCRSPCASARDATSNRRASYRRPPAGSIPLEPSRDFSGARGESAKLSENLGCGETRRYLRRAEEYVRRLGEADVFIMDSRHEPFGLPALDAIKIECSLLVSCNRRVSAVSPSRMVTLSRAMRTPSRRQTDPRAFSCAKRRVPLPSSRHRRLEPPERGAEARGASALRLWKREENENSVCYLV